jgi:hypothetical protein
LTNRTLALAGCTGIIALFVTCAPALMGDTSPPLLRCSYALFGDKDRKVVVPGQRTELRVKRHRVEVPAGAAPAGATFDIRAPSGRYRMVKFVQFPQDTLQSPADLFLSFEGCPSGNAEDYRILRRPNDSGKWEEHTGRHEVVGNAVKISVSKFSTYALASN